MIQNREPKEFDDDRKKWKIYFDLNHERKDLSVLVKFTTIHKEYSLTEEDIEKLKQDLKDLGKFRIITEGRNFLEKSKK